MISEDHKIFCDKCDIHFYNERITLHINPITKDNDCPPLTFCSLRCFKNWCDLSFRVRGYKIEIEWGDTVGQFVQLEQDIDEMEGPISESKDPFIILDPPVLMQ